jgi:hypothetical protein
VRSDALAAGDGEGGRTCPNAGDGDIPASARPALMLRHVVQRGRDDCAAPDSISSPSICKRSRVDLWPTDEKSVPAAPSRPGYVQQSVSGLLGCGPRQRADPPLVNTCVSGGPQALVRRSAARLNMLVTCSRSRRRASRGHPQPEGTATSQHEPRGAQDLVAALNVVYGCPARRPSMRRASATAPASFCRRRRRRKSRASSLTLARKAPRS